MKTYAIILAAGKGTRMKSELPKVMHRVCGVPMIEYLVTKLKNIGVDKIIAVVGHKAEVIEEHFGSEITFVRQEEQLGTGHAVQQVAQILEDKEGHTLILTGDTPLLTEQTLKGFLNNHKTNSGYEKGMVLTTLLSEPTGYGRIIKENGRKVKNIVEEKDATEEQKKIKEINTGIFCFDNKTLFKYISGLKNNNKQREYYLTDIVDVFNQNGFTVRPYSTENVEEVIGINDKVVLSEAESILRKEIIKKHMKNAVIITDPSSVYIDSTVIIEPNVVIQPNVMLKGHTVIGINTEIGMNCEIEDAIIGSDVRIKQSVIVKSKIGNEVIIGPFAHIRPESEIGDECRIGNFVETKKSSFGRGSKASHLSYIGDAEIGEKVNLGCGSITVNYDGKNKYKTTIEDGAFIGCNVNLIAPVKVEKNTLIGAGSTITKNVPQNALAIARVKQINKENWRKK